MGEDGGGGDKLFFSFFFPFVFFSFSVSYFFLPSIVLGLSMYCIYLSK